MRTLTTRWTLPVIIILALVTLALLALMLFTSQVHVHIPGTAWTWPN